MKKGSSSARTAQQRRLFRSNDIRMIDKGVLALITTGNVPKYSDMTDHLLLETEESPFCIESTVLYPGHRQFEKKPLHTVAEYGDDYSQIKFDLSEDSEQESSRGNRSPNRPSFHFKQFSPNIVPFGEQQQTTVYTNRREDERLHALPNIHTQLIGQEDNNEEDTQSEESAPRKYGELLDEYSLHEIIIRKGKVLSSTPEFLSYRRKYRALWTRISTILNMLEALMEELKVPTAFIDGKAVFRFAEENQQQLTVDQLLECIINFDSVRPFVDASKYRNLTGSKIAAGEELGRLHNSAKAIQRWWRVQLSYRFTRRAIERLRIKDEISWKNVMTNFVKNWKTISKVGYIVVHIPSHSFDSRVREGIFQFSHKQNSQIFRLVELVMDPRVLHIVYICSIPCDEQFLQYIFNLLLIHSEPFGTEKRRLQKLKKKLSFIYPCDSNMYPPHYSLTQKLYLSERSMKLLRTKIMIERQKAVRRFEKKYGENEGGGNPFPLSSDVCVVIIPGVRSSSWELKLAQRLQIPLFGVYDSASTVYNTKSNIRRLFEFADVNTGPGAVDLFDQQEILIHLSRLIIRNPQYDRWLIKINNQFGSYGHGYLDVNEEIEVLSERGRSQIYEKLEQQEQSERFLEVLQDHLYYELQSTMPKKFKLCRNFYSGWSDFVQSISRVGCSIEAVPENIVGNTSVNLRIEPNGKVVVESIQENIISMNYSVIGCAYVGGYYDADKSNEAPTTKGQRVPTKLLQRNLRRAIRDAKGFGSPVPLEVLHEASNSIANVLYSKHIMGFVTVDFISFVTEDNSLKLWGVDIDLGLTDQALCHKVYSHLISTLPLEKRVTKSYIHGGLMRHDGLSRWMHESFFALCRQNGIGLDMDAFKGTVFQLVDGKLQSFLGVLCIGDSVTETLTEYDHVISFIYSLIKDELDQESNIDEVYQCIRDIVSKLEEIERK